MKKKNRFSLGKKIKYILDDFVSKGFWAQTLLLMGTSIALTLLFGIVTMRLTKESYVEGYWISLMHMLDQGTITGDQIGSDAYFMFMMFVTIIGMAFTSTIIAIISSAIQDKLNELKKGHSGIIEKGHVVILGFDKNTYTICREIAMGSLINDKRICLVVADDLPKEEMEHTMKEFRSGQRQYFEHPAAARRSNRRIKMLFRSGDIVSENTFSVCAACYAKAIVINREKDTETIRILLSLAAYLKKNNAYLNDERMPCIVALIHDRDNLSAAFAAADICSDSSMKNRSKIQIKYDGNMLESLLVQSCVQQGLPFVMDGLFNYRGSSIRIEPEKCPDSAAAGPFIGKSLREISAMLPAAIPLGFVRKYADGHTEASLAPQEELSYEKGDCLVYLSRSNDLLIEEPKHIEPVGVRADAHSSGKKSRRNFLFLGHSSVLAGMLKSVNKYCVDVSSVNLILSDSEKLDPLQDTAFDFRRICCDDPYNWRQIKRIFEENSFWFDSDDSRELTNIVLLSQDGIDKSEADEKVMVLLLNIRSYLRDRGLTGISITTEMLMPQNQILLQNNNSDFVVATEITNRLIAQITDDPRKHYIIDELLGHKNTLIELRPISEYVDVLKPFNFEAVFKAAEADGIPLGWLKDAASSPAGTQSPLLVLTPTKEEREAVYPADSLNNCRLVILVNGSLR